MTNNIESMLRKKEWDKRWQRDVNGMAALAWKVTLETDRLIIYETINKHLDRHYLFPDDMEVLHTLGYVQQIDFDYGVIRVFVQKWKHHKKELDN